MSRMTRRDMLGAVGATVVAAATAPGKGKRNKPGSSSHFTCEVLVYGATPSGIAAAVTAARMGHTVILAEYEDQIGGILTNGLTNTDLGHRGTVGGFFDELSERVLAYYRQEDAGNPDMPNVRACRKGLAYEPHVVQEIFNQFVAEQAPRLRLLLRHELKQAIRDENRVTGAVFEPRDKPGQRVQVDAAVLIDATYEGDLAGMAKAKYRLGRESKDDFGEPHAGRLYMKMGTTEPLPGSTGEGDKAIQAYCFRFSATTNPANRVPVSKLPGYRREDYLNLLEDAQCGKIKRLSEAVIIFPMPKEKYEFLSLHCVGTTGVPRDSMDLAEECWPWPEATPQERRKIYERYLSHNVGLIWFLQNDPEVPEELRKDAQRYGWCKDEFVTNGHLPWQVYVREGRRIEGEYLLTEHDGDLSAGWERARVQPTSIAVLEWGFDSHGCHRYDPAHPGVREGYMMVPCAVFQVPYGTVVPKEVDGLLVPVACSATHVAYGGLRLEPAFMALGEACGQAAHLALKDHVQVRAVSVERLQQNILENGGVITCLDDLPQTDEAFVACQWLGARGLNKGYQAEPGKVLRRAEAAERLRRVLEIVKRPWVGPSEGDLISSLKAEDVVSWLRSAGFQAPATVPARLKNGELTVRKFALLVYGVAAPAPL